jgi:hypothetical protein
MMAKYLVRVELHNATRDDYEALHLEMALRSFCREVTGSSGRAYQLPTAEYVMDAEEEVEDVRALAAEAARSTGRKFAVVAVEYSRSAWVGLAYA